MSNNPGRLYHPQFTYSPRTIHDRLCYIDAVRLYGSTDDLTLCLYQNGFVYRKTSGEPGGIEVYGISFKGLFKLFLLKKEYGYENVWETDVVR